MEHTSPQGPEAEESVPNAKKKKGENAKCMLHFSLHCRLDLEPQMGENTSKFILVKISR